jgi:ATP/ADP translocase
MLLHCISLRNTDFKFFLQQKALDAAMNDINSSFGKGSVTRLGSAGGAFVYVSSLSIRSIKSQKSITTRFIVILIVIIQLSLY